MTRVRDRSGEAGETTKIGSTEGKSPTALAGTPNLQHPHQDTSGVSS
jgi:hypothetical protein